MVLFQFILLAVAFAFLLMGGLAVLLVRMGREDWRLRTLAGRLQGAFWLYSSLNGLAAFTWIMTLVEILPLRTRFPLSDYGAPLGAVVLLMLVPLALPVCRLLQRRGGIEDAPQSLRHYAGLSTIFLIGSLFPGAQLLLFYALHFASDR